MDKINMYSILPSLLEALAIKDVNMTKGKKPAVFMAGRFQPCTKAHAGMISDMISGYSGKEPFVFVVKGLSTSENKEKNPLDIELQKKIIRKSVPGIQDNIIEIEDAFIGTMINELRNRGYEPVVYLCGSDRVNTYNDQLKRYATVLDVQIEIKEFARTTEDISATKVRKAIKDGDIELFKTLTVNLGEKEFNLLRGAIK